MSTSSATPQVIPAVGDRVEIDVKIAGETLPVEVIVAQVDDEGPRGTRIIGRPEGALVTAFAAYDWREVVA